MNIYFAIKLFLRAQVALLLPLMLMPAHAAIAPTASQSLPGSSLSIEVTDLETETNAPVLVADDDDDYDRDDEDDDYDRDDEDDDYDRDDEDRDYDTPIQSLQWRRTL